MVVVSSEGRSGQEPSAARDYLAPADPSQSTGRVPYVALHGADTPWGDDRRAMEKSLLVKTAVLHGDMTDDGMPLPVFLSETFRENWQSVKRNEDLVHDFLRQYPDYLERRKPSGDLVWVRPTEKATLLIQRIQSSGTQEGDGVAAETAGLDPQNPPRERAATVLRRCRMVRTDRQRALLLDLLAQEGERVVDESGEPKTLHLDGRPPQEAGSRFTAPARAAQTRARFVERAAALTSRYDVASGVTLTMPRECVRSVYESVEVVRGALDRLHTNRFTYSRQDRPRPGYVPDYVAVLEPQRDLTAHLHVVYGGEERVMARDDLRDDWADLLDAPASKPPQVEVQTLSLDSEGWPVTAIDGEDVEAYGDFRAYLGTGTRTLTTLAGMTPDALHGLADDLRSGALVGEDREEACELAGLALVWATGRRFTTASRGLTGTQNGGNR